MEEWASLPSEDGSRGNGLVGAENGGQGAGTILLLLLLFWTITIGKCSCPWNPPYGSSFPSLVSVGPDSMLIAGRTPRHNKIVSIILGSRQRQSRCDRQTKLVLQ